MRNVLLITDRGLSLKHNLTATLLRLHQFPSNWSLSSKWHSHCGTVASRVFHQESSSEARSNQRSVIYAVVQRTIKDPWFVTNISKAVLKGAWWCIDCFAYLFDIHEVSRHTDLTCVSMVINYWEIFSVRQLKSNCINNEQVCVLL